MIDLDREAWLNEAADLLINDRIEPATGRPAPHPFRVSVGFPPRSRANSKVLAVCCASAASADQHNEIFVSPAISDSIDVLAALAHELVHQSDDCQSGHRNHFARTARLIGLEGKLTATTPSADLRHYLQSEIVDTLGPIPHAALDIGKAKKKQSTRMIKVMCDGCGFHFRASQTQIDLITTTACLACDTGNLHTV